MWKGCYGKEPFDLRLTVLRFLRNFAKMIAFTLIGTLIFGGGYYVKNVLLRPERQYSATSTFKVEYVTPPVHSGDYYINEATWNTLVQSGEFLSGVQVNLANTKIYGGDASHVEKLEMSMEELAAAISAKLPSDWNIPTITVVTNDASQTMWLAYAVEVTMVNDFAANMEEVQSVRVIDSPVMAEEVELDVRPVRAFVLSAILSFFFSAVIFLLKELGNDSIWLPATLRRRYGLAALGTINSPELEENIAYLFRDMEKIAVCSVDGEVDTTEVVKALQEKNRKSWIAIPAPLMCPESCRTLREMEGTLLVVQAGGHAGKPLEYVMEYLAQQDCEITAVILWDADEWLIDAYYCFRKREI